VVVQLYTDSVPGNALAIYLPTLQSLATTGSSSVTGLEGLPADWAAASADPIFRFCQDYVSDSLYYLPAVQYARDIGVQYPLTLLCIYDACIQHGDGDDPDGLQAMIDRANQKAGGTPAEGVSEAKWLRDFNHVREKTLKNPSNEATQEEWRESVGRVKALEDLRKDGNYLLDRSQIEVNPYGENHVINL
jgi:chitosanase